MRREIDAEPKNRLLNVNEAEYLNYLVQKYSIDPLVFQWDDMFVTDKEVMIPAEQFPRTFEVLDGKSYPKQVITYHIPFTGEPDLLKKMPSSRILWSTDVEVTGRTLTFDIVNLDDDAAQISRDADWITSNIRTQNKNVTQEVNQFNAGLPVAAQAAMQHRKQQHLQQASLLESLGVPVKRSDKVSETFTVPIVQRRVIIKPAAPDTAYNPEPTLDNSLCAAILQLCRSTGVEMERHPRIYADKDEETLRDFFIMVLSPHFHSVTGETFNKSGKTDILVRHESANVFVAECKFWSGAKAFHKTINQVLGYLTWRDSKAAIILFVRNKELTPVFEQIKPAATSHRCYVSMAKPNDESWSNFNFHLLDDSTRGVRLAVLCFHLPPE